LVGPKLLVRRPGRAAVTRTGERKALSIQAVCVRGVRRGRSNRCNEKCECNTRSAHDGLPRGLVERRGGSYRTALGTPHASRQVS
jgi:hypothetical protein